MTIDKKKLIDLLVEKTSMDRQEIKKQLDQLIERILDAAKRGKALEIKEFGLFYFDEAGELKFEASDELSTEISFKYAGMKPVEIKPGRDTKISAVEEQADDDDDEKSEEKSPEDDEDLFESDPFEDTDEDDFSDIEGEVEEEDEKDILEDPFAPEALEPLEEPVEEEPKSKLEDVKPSPRQPVRKRKDHTGLFILLVIVILSVLIGGYFYYVSTQTQDLEQTAEPSTTQTETQMGGESSAMPDETPPTVDNQNEESNPVTTEDEQQSPGEQSETQSPDPLEQEDANEVTEDDATGGTVSIAETDQPMYGLRGSVIEEANNGYSIVVHSFTTEETAQNAADRLRTEGYRVIVNPRTVNGNSVWRVSVGQFETLGAAQQATTRLPNPYNTQNFIQRIQLN